jgi:multidrug efflux pump subunit AcrA (membrane-fusion protein)
MGQGAAAGGLSLAATGFKMLGDYVSSRGEAGAATYKSELLEQQAEYGRLKATQTNAQLTRNLAISLSHLDAIRAAGHTDPFSPTGAAVRGEMEATGQMRKDITVENIMRQTRMDEANAAYMRSQASNALLSGDIAMLGDAFQGMAGAFQNMPGSPDLRQPLPGSTPLGQGGIGSA